MKTNATALSHTEVITLAIKTIEAEIRQWGELTPDTPAGFAMLRSAIEEARAKRACLLQMFQIETGVPYE